MDLPILNAAPTATQADLLRFYGKLVAERSLALGESEQLDVGLALHSPSLHSLDQANRVIDAALPPGADADAAIDAVDAFYRGQYLQCLAWTFNASSDDFARQPLTQALEYRGFQRRTHAIVHTQRVIQTDAASLPSVQILPARSAYRHARLLAEERAAAEGNAQVADALMLYLDEPRYDVQIALQDNVPIATVGVLTVGDMGLIADLYVSPAMRGRGVGRTILSRAADYCVRSMFRHVFAGVDATDAMAIHLLARLGLTPVGEFVECVRVANDARQ